VKLLLIGMNHRTAPVAFRERFAVADPSEALSQLMACEFIDEVALISTCNRVEILMVLQNDCFDETVNWLYSEFFMRLAGEESLPAGTSLESACYEYRGREMVRHLFRVSASLDSLVVGEPQILGQVKDAFRLAQEAGTTGQVLNRLFERAFLTAKRTRRETTIAEGAVSVARVAVTLGQQIFESFDDKIALLIGAGEMIEAAAKALCAEGLSNMQIANRTLSRAEHLAAEFNASAHRLDEVPELLRHSDVVMLCIGGDGVVLDKQMVKAALSARRGRPLFIIDIGVPRNVADDVNDLPGVYMYDLDDLSEAANQNVEQRRQATNLAEEIVLDEEHEFQGWMSALQVVPTIRELRDSAEAIREQEHKKAFKRLELSDEQREAVEALTRSIINKILHAPLAHLRGSSSERDVTASVNAARQVFGLESYSLGETSREESASDEDQKKTDKNESTLEKSK
jgi:glutamyl-tRNA reductase